MIDKDLQQVITSSDLPVQVGEIELADPIGDLEILESSEGIAYRMVKLLVRLHRHPIGYVLLKGEPIRADELAAAIWQQLAPKIQQHLSGDGVESPHLLTRTGIETSGKPNCQTIKGESEPFISVIVCTRDRPEGAVAAINGLLALEYTNYEIVLVDNAPSTDATERLIREEFASCANVRYVREPRPGLSCARNRGIIEAKGQIIAFTDDDVEVDAWWLRGIILGFSRSTKVGCVTGLVPSAKLENSVQLYFDQRVSWGTSCERRIFDLVENRDDSILYPYSAGIFGTGANFAFDRKIFEEIGYFDEALGAGAPPGGGEDLDIFVRTLFAGWKIVYEPSAIIGHVHRAELDQLDKQMFNYGSGFSAFAAKYVLNPKTGIGVIARLPKGLIKLRRVAKRVGDNPLLPASIMAREFKGMAWGPYLYLKGKIYTRKLG